MKDISYIYSSRLKQASTLAGAADCREWTVCANYHTCYNSEPMMWHSDIDNIYHEDCWDELVFPKWYHYIPRVW